VSLAALSRYPAHVLLAALCTGVAAANLARGVWFVPAGLLCGFAAVGAGTEGRHRLVFAALALAALGWWWGSLRLDLLDRSVLVSQIGRAERSRLVVTAPARRSRFALRVDADMRRFGRLRVDEPVLLQLPLGRAPPQGAILEVLGVLKRPRGPSHGFDERAWLRRHGVHVVLVGDRWRIVGHRGGLGGLADRLRSALAGSMAPGLRGERRAVIEGVVLGDEQGLSDGLRQRFRASGLYHLLAVSGQNVALVAAGALACAWLLGLPRWFGELGALASIGGYVLAVGAQPSVIRAGVAGALASLAWLTARAADRWYLLLLGALTLLAWNPYDIYDPGFQLSFAAVAAIFVGVPRLQRVLEGYPLPHRVAGLVAVSTACGLATSPILWFQFGAVPLLTVPANALAAPAVVPLLGLAAGAAALAHVAPAAAATLAWLNGLCAAYLAGCARLVGGLPFTQIRSGWAAAALGSLGLGGAAYAWRRWQSSTSPTS
jgi:competence protein ComEC